MSANGTSQITFSEDAERALICSVLIGGDRVAVELSVPKAAFFVPANQIVWEAITDLLEERRPVDFITLKHRLDRLDQLEEAGGSEYLNELYSFLPTSANYRYYSDIVLDHWRLRNAIGSTKDLLFRLENRGKTTWEELRSEVEQGLVSMVNEKDERERSSKDITMDWFDELAQRKEHLARDGIAFGVPGLDKKIGMQQPGELVTIGAGTSQGKTMLAYQGVAYNCRTRNIPVGLISLEMTARQSWDRLASHIKQISMSRFRAADFRDEDIVKINEFSQEMPKIPIWFCDKRLDIEGIKSQARRWRARYGIKLLVVDYLQRVGVPKSMHRSNRQEQVAYISNQLKDLALELGIVVWCPVQLNQEGNVRESATIEHDSDIYLRIKMSDKAKVLAQIVFEKVRQGERADPLPVKVLGWTQTIEERKEESGS